MRRGGTGDSRNVLRGGAFKPRTSPYVFQGFGVEGLRHLKAAARANRPVLLKRGLAATAEEWLYAAGIARIIPALARASIAAGADGVAVEVHLRPEEARSDGAQALLPQELLGIVADARVIAAATGRRLHASQP